MITVCRHLRWNGLRLSFDAREDLCHPAQRNTTSPWKDRVMKEFWSLRSSTNLSTTYAVLLP